MNKTILIAAASLALLVGCNNDCKPGFGSCIPIDEEPSCVDLVSDECVDEVIEEFCPVCSECDACDPISVDICEGGNWTCADFEDGRPNGHKPKECR